MLETKHHCRWRLFDQAPGRLGGILLRRGGIPHKRTLAMSD
jgi:hypothetical protein